MKLHLNVQYSPINTWMSHLKQVMLVPEGSPQCFYYLNCGCFLMSFWGEARQNFQGELTDPIGNTTGSSGFP